MYQHSHPFEHGEEYAVSVNQIHVIDTREGFEAVRDAYEALHQRDPDAGVFLSWGWLVRIFDDMPGDWCVLAVEDTRVPEGFSAFLPLHRSLHWSKTNLSFQTRYTAAGRLGLSDYVGFVCAPEHEVEALETLGDFVAGAPWARFTLRYEPTGRRSEIFASRFQDDDVLVEWAEHRINDGATNQMVCPVLDLSDSYEDYLSTLRPRARKNLRRAERALEEMGGCDFRVSTAATLEQDCAALMALWERKWADQKSETRLTDLRDRYAAFLKRGQELGLLYVVSLWQGERMLGALAHLVDRDARLLHSVIEGRDPGFPDLGIGLLLHHFAIRKAIEAGCTAYDFGHGDAEYKYRLGAEDQHVTYLTLVRQAGEGAQWIDPGMMQSALRRTEGFLRRNRVDFARAALRQLAELH
jgi:CelD/BcsL family acetyltransferase involved in cellulose biosynthesis